ncbi:hypothetical protein ACHWQZ_G004593 [Mnemiopsis leidyi]
MSSSNKNKNNNSFDKYCSRLGYPHNMAKDAQKKLGNQASNSELLAAVLNNAKANGVQPNRSTHPNYLQKQDCYQTPHGAQKVPIWIHKDDKNKNKKK